MITGAGKAAAVSASKSDPALGNPRTERVQRPMSLTIRILGLDPGLSAMGWGVIDVAGSRLSHVAHGVIATKPAAGLAMRLMALHRELSAVIQAHAPAAIAVEQAF